MNLTSLLRSVAFTIFLLLSTCFIPYSVAQLDVTKFSKTLSTLASDGLGTATLQVSHLSNTLLLSFILLSHFPDRCKFTCILQSKPCFIRTQSLLRTAFFVPGKSTCSFLNSTPLRTCLHEGGGPQVGGVTHLSSLLF